MKNILCSWKTFADFKGTLRLQMGRPEQYLLKQKKLTQVFQEKLMLIK